MRAHDAAEEPKVARVVVLTKSLDSAGVAATARIITSICAAHGRYGENARPEEEHPIPKAEDVDRLEAYAKERIARGVEDASIWRVPRLPMVLSHWARLKGDDRVREAVAKWTSDASSYDELVAQLVSFVIRSSGGRTGTRSVINLKAVDRLFEREAAAERARELLRKDGRSERHRAALAMLVDAHDGVKSDKRDPMDDF